MTDKYKSLNRLLGERVEERGAAVLQLEAEAETLELEVAVLEEEQEDRRGQGKHGSGRFQTVFSVTCSLFLTQYCNMFGFKKC